MTPLHCVSTPDFQSIARKNKLIKSKKGSFIFLIKIFFFPDLRINKHFKGFEAIGVTALWGVGALMGVGGPETLPIEPSGYFNGLWNQIRGEDISFQGASQSGRRLGASLPHFLRCRSQWSLIEFQQGLSQEICQLPLLPGQLSRIFFGRLFCKSNF